MIEHLWAETTQRATDLPRELQSRRVDGEWSFIETLRHLVLATDCWLSRGIQLARRPYHPWGLPWSGAGPNLAEEIGLDTSAEPDLAQVLPVRLQHQKAVSMALDSLTDGDLAEVRTAPKEPGHPNGEHSVLQCFHVLLNEEWEHHRYAVRDLGMLDR